MNVTKKAAYIAEVEALQRKRVEMAAPFKERLDELQAINQYSREQSSKLSYLNYELIRQMQIAMEVEEDAPPRAWYEGLMFAACDELEIIYEAEAVTNPMVSEAKSTLVTINKEASLWFDGKVKEAAKRHGQVTESMAKERKKATAEAVERSDVTRTCRNLQ